MYLFRNVGNSNLKVMKMPRWRNPIPNPIPIPIPNPIPIPGINVGEVLGDAIGGIQDALSSIGDAVDYRNDFFNRLNDEAKNLVGEMEEWVAEAGGISDKELTSMLVKRISPQLKVDTNGESLQNLFRDEAVSLFREQYSSAGPQICMFVVAGLMIAAAVVIIVVAPAITPLAETLIIGAFALAAAGCAIQ
ncbi:hypothetical protein ABFY57_10105 [Paenibacillus polymyxa]|uniref:hypothetical protein n=1 Tax=Paenibacillus polymyxa TaxID=1406 RepID=UPI003D2D04D4